MFPEIISEMAMHGLNPGSLQLDGKVHRFKADERDHKKSGWYKGFQNTTRGTHQDFQVIVYGNFKTGDSYKYNTNGVTYTAEDKKFIEDKIRKAKKDELAERNQIQENVANEASKLWESLDDEGPSDYLTRKHIDSAKELGIKFNGLGDFYVPIKDIQGKVWSTQTIKGKRDSQGRDKLFRAGGRIKACFHAIGSLDDQPVFYFAEGFATAASIRIATGATVICCFNSGNLESVASAFREKYLDTSFVICGDEDRWKDKNAGREAAEKTAQITGAKVIFPIFKSDDTKPTDFNDLHALDGIDEVKRQILQIKPLEVPEEVSADYIIRTKYPDDTDDDKQAHRGTLDNFAELLRRLRYSVRYNVISKEEEIIIPRLNFSMDNRQNATRAMIVDWCERVKIPYANLDAYITALADANPYNPVASWITLHKWDGTSRMQDFFETVTAVNEDKDINLRLMKERLMLLWMISAVAAVFEPYGVSAHGVLVFQGAQYLGKTMWFKNLVGPELSDVIADGVTIHPDNKDSVMVAVSKWLVELGELDGTLSKSDESQLKAWIKKKYDELRRPFAKKVSKYARRTVFFGSVNPEKFLKDPTGNRIFWTIPCEKINHSHGLDMQQIWAEIYENHYLKGLTWYLSGTELEGLNSSNENFMQESPIAELITDEFDWGNESATIKKYSATEVLKILGYREPKIGDCKKAGEALRKLAKDKPTMVNGLARFSVPIRPRNFRG